MEKCQCEHISHFETDKQTPNGNPGHDYGQGFHMLFVKQTRYGNFAVCKDCLHDCMQDQ